MGQLELCFERRGERTVLVHAFADAPYRVGRVFEVDDAAYAIIVSAGPGVFGGDVWRQTVHVGEGARVVLTSQSALQVHPGGGECAGVPATIASEYHVSPDAELHVVWDPVIPFAGASLRQRIAIALASSSRLYWSDALLAGRVSRGESWCFNAIDHELALRVDGSLRYLERYRIAPSDSDPRRRWIAGDATHAGTILVHDARVTADGAALLHDHLGRSADVFGAVDVPDPQVMVARILSSRGAAFADARERYRALCLAEVLGTPALAMRKTV